MAPRIKIGINGFGSLGRFIARAALLSDSFDLVAINEPFQSQDYMVSMFKDGYASLPPIELSIEDEKTLLFNNKPAILFHHRKPEDIPWAETGAEYIVEATRVFTDRAEAAAHLKEFVHGRQGGAKKVIICAPSKDTPIVVVGANEKTYTSDLDVVSSHGFIATCLSPLIKLMEEKFGIAKGSVAIAYSNSVTRKSAWMLGEGPFELQDMGTEDVNAIRQVVPGLNANLAWKALRLPNNTPVPAKLEFTVNLKNPATYDEIKTVIKDKSGGELRGIVGYEDESAVARAVVGDSRSCTLDAEAGGPLGNMVNLVAWFDLNWANSIRVIDLIEHMHMIDG